MVTLFCPGRPMATSLEMSWLFVLSQLPTGAIAVPKCAPGRPAALLSARGTTGGFGFAGEGSSVRRNCQKKTAPLPPAASGAPTAMPGKLAPWNCTMPRPESEAPKRGTCSEGGGKRLGPGLKTTISRQGLSVDSVCCGTFGWRLETYFTDAWMVFSPT